MPEKTQISGSQIKKRWTIGAAGGLILAATLGVVSLYSGEDENGQKTFDHLSNGMTWQADDLQVGTGSDVTFEVDVSTKTAQVHGTLSGGLLVLSKFRNCNLETSSSGAVICGTDDTGGGGGSNFGSGNVIAIADARYVNTAGDTMTGNLLVRATISGSNLRVDALKNCNTIDTDANGNLVCGSDEGTTYVAGQGLALVGTTFRLNSTVTGSLVRALNTLASSGTLVFEGAGSGSSLYLGTSLEGAGLVDCDTAGTSKLLWNSATGRFSCGTDQNTGTSYTAGQGLALNGTGFRTNVILTGSLVSFTTVSGSLVKAQTLASSGSLTWEGTASGATLYVGGALQGVGLATCNGASQKLLWSGGRFSCGTDQDTDTNTTYTAGQGTTLTSTSFKTNAILTGSLVSFTTISGSTVKAKDSLASSGSLAVDGGASFNNALFTLTSFTGCSALETDGNGNLVCGSDADTNTTYTAGQGLGLNGTTFSVNATLTGSLIRFSTVSGSTVFARHSLNASGSLAVDGAAAFNNSSILLTSFQSCSALETDSSGGLVCGSDANTTYTAAKGLSLNGTAFSLSDTITGSALRISGTMSGKQLVVSQLRNCNTIDTTSTGAFVCGTDEGGAGGLSYATAEGIFLNQGGDTATGTLTINITGGSQSTVGLKVLQTLSGAVIRATKALVSSGTLVVESGSLLQYPVFITTQSGFTTSGLRFRNYITPVGAFRTSTAVLESWTTSRVNNPAFVFTSTGSTTDSVWNIVEFQNKGLTKFAIDQNGGFTTQSSILVQPHVLTKAATQSLYLHFGVTGNSGVSSNNMGGIFAAASTVAASKQVVGSQWDGLEFFIMPNVEFGIGTTDPGSPLSVSGSAIIGPNITTASAKATLDIKGTMSGAAITLSGKPANTLVCYKAAGVLGYWNVSSTGTLIGTCN